MRWRKVTLVGVGLLGGSLGQALRTRGLAREVHGYVRREGSVAECVEAGAIDEGTTDLRKAVSDADLIVFCTPLGQMAALAAECAGSVVPNALVTDVGSVKAAVVNELEGIFQSAGAVFIGSHPMAGSERTGVSAARADLFVNAACAVTPTPASPSEKVAEVEGLWRGVGGRVIQLTPEEHDALVARSSHLPHVLAAHLAAFVLGAKRGPDQARLCANGFKDSTRIASGSPEMWRDIVLMNRENMELALDQFGAALEGFRAMLARNSAGEIEEFFREAKELRDRFGETCGTAARE